MYLSLKYIIIMDKSNQCESEYFKPPNVIFQSQSSSNPLRVVLDVKTIVVYHLHSHC